MVSSLVQESPEYQPDEVIYRQGEPGQRYFVIEQGALRLTRVNSEGRMLEVRRLGPGEAFGETSLLLGDVRDATAEAIAPTRLLFIEKEEFDLLAKTEPSIERALQMRPEVAERRHYPRFPWLEKGELPIKVLHKHRAFLLLGPALLIPSLLALAFLAGSIALLRFAGPLALVIGLIPTLAFLGGGLYAYIDWRNDIYVVTNRRVVHRERIGLVQQRFSAAPLHAIQDIQQIQIGLAARFFRYGDLIIETAGEAGQVVFRSIPEPGQVRDLIFGQRERAWAVARAQEQAAIRQALRQHFLGEEALPAREQQQEVSKPPRRWGCLLVPLALLRSLLPPARHVEGSTVTWRKHWVALLGTAMLPALILLATAAIAIAVSLLLPSEGASATVAFAVVALITIPWLLWKFDDWQNDQYQVTATRIIDVQRTPLYFRETRREASLEQITNIRFEQSFWGRVFGYGDIIVETAAPAGTFHFRTVGHPQDVQKEIFAHIEAARVRRQRQEAQQRRAEMLDWLSAYEELHRTTPPEQESL